ncbi:hypothetical protein GUITHDRAFT_107116 [Guillardia theta CCMP2712]|uniref:RNA polymerase I-specific transcription initiation factor RRN3 n=1 Tax=Guillardia theta (strain CCMP2712) TaxID=905079 RepID=L1JFC5_GUITC|nr:hypothetical protein GUITHDRAFT_107116 [Guillardia theta CCMP2712]EKX47206.1 hypothetical protein GUITHDRAFT_107116 [Guillardia theta CCMP2712]|eukprot:XP_005834186.1 hypothetical protein GUITHDRAFT_107116 [Guillardia theta CCMP2712]
MTLGILLTKATCGDSSELQQYIVGALHKKAQGNSTAYGEMIEVIDAERDDAELAVLLTCLIRCTSCLQRKHHSSLIHSIFAHSWRTNRALTPHLEALAVNSVSANADLLSLILFELVKQLTLFNLNPTGNDASSAIDSAGKEAEHPSSDAADVQKAKDVHTVVRRVLETFPTGIMCYLDLLVNSFPHHRKDLSELVCFLGNMLHVTEYLPQLQDGILNHVVDRLIRLDVEIDPEAISVGHDANSTEGLFDIDIDDSSTSERSENMKAVEKLDAMMTLMFRFFHKNLGKRAGHDRDQVFSVLLRIFDSRVLTTFRSKYVQFLCFYSCHFRERYSREFLQYLMTKVVERSNPDNERHAAGSYLGSFLARARFVKLPMVQKSLSLLTKWILEYIDEVSPTVHEPDPYQHSLFYGLVQALLYVLCFRVPQLVADERNYDTFLRFELQLDVITRCSLNPLKVINQNVSKQFVRICVKYKLLQAEMLRNLLAYNQSIVVNGVLEFEQEHSFFPFDNYNLPLSRTFIDGANEASSSQLGSSVEDAEGVAMSLNSQLSLSDQGPHNSFSPSWKPMSFSPPHEEKMNGMRMLAESQMRAR